MIQCDQTMKDEKKVAPEEKPIPEQKSIPETRSVIEVVESTTEKEEEKQTQPETVLQKPIIEPAMTVTTKPLLSAQTQDRLEKEIEEILEEDLADLYAAMPKEKQMAFKAKGEETRSIIRQLVQSFHINTKKIFHLIRAWLKMIPGVNRFFLEQEAKIKTDKVIFIAEEEKRRGLK